MSRDRRKKRSGGRKALLVVMITLLCILLGVLAFLIASLIRLNNGQEVSIPFISNRTVQTAPVLVPQTAGTDGTSQADQTAQPGTEAQADGTGEAAGQPENTAQEQDYAAVQTPAAQAVPVAEEPAAEPYVPRSYETDEAGNLVIPAQQAGYFQGEPHFAPTFVKTGDALLDEANRQAAMYDYDAAIDLITAAPGYEANEAYTAAIADYEQKKSELVQWGRNDLITHIFFHSLVVDTGRAFSHEIAISEQDGTDKVTAYNEVMTTIDEFVAILEQMYARGYVMVRLDDIAKMVPGEDGTMEMRYQPILLPKGKIPFILSQDDVSYYAYMHGHGFATRMVLDENGLPTSEYELEDGTLIYGSYDLVPIVDDFVETHPDFSYHGAKGIIALTGYEGILGYRTSDYWYNWSCDYFQEENAEKRAKYYYNNENIEQDKQEAARVAQAMKEDGWVFASHSWSHRDMQTSSAEFVAWDADIWNKEVAPLVGGTDILIYPKGADIDSWRGYAADNPKFLTFKQYGFNYFCNVDSSQYWIQIGSNRDYFRMGRRNIDGTRLWQAISYYADPAAHADWSEDTLHARTLDDLIDARSVFDWARPTPVE